MDLIELLKDFTNSQNNYESKQNALLEQFLDASMSDLKGLSNLLCESPDTYLPTFQSFISLLCNESSHSRIKKKNTSLHNFTSLLITVIIKNLHRSDILGFGKCCIELLQLAGLKQTMKNVFSEILNTDGVLGVLITDASNCGFLKRIWFGCEIEQEELLRAVDVVAAFVEECSEHREFSYDLSEYKACTALLETLRGYYKEFGHWNLKPSIEDAQRLELLRMVMPEQQSDLPHFLEDLEKRKVNLFQDLIEFSSSCTSCHEQALNDFSYGKYILEKMPQPSLRLPFEFNDDDSLGPWDVLLSDDTIEDMQSLEYHVVRTVMKKLGHIASGEWSKYKLQCMAWDKHELRHTMQTHVISVYEIELPDNGLRILWSVDCGFSIRGYSLTQLVKVWAVTTDQEKIHKILKNLSVVHRVYTAKHIDRCIVKQTDKDNNKILPIIFPDKEETKSSDEEKLHSYIDDERLLEIHKMFVTNKFVPLSTNLFKSLVLGGLKFTFQISQNEYDIIRNPSSAIIIGRSGTGKTTCIVFRQITSYLNTQLCDNDKSLHKRQIFITKSSRLCYEVRKYFHKLQKSAMLAGKKMTMKQYYEYKKKKEEEEEDTKMFEEGDEETIPIPNSFRQLADHHFPLFVTYKRFSKMLMKTYGINSQNLNIHQSDENNIDDDDGGDDDQDKYYKVFQKDYWPYLDKGLDCGLLYSEFSIIKGTNPEVDYLSKENYRDISTKKYPAFCHNRDHIYDLFQQYEKMKRRNNYYDLIDRTLAILHSAKIATLGGPHIHEVYVDECQDNQIVDLALILKVFERADSFLFAGDIAQCIARGSSFRFQDLSALIYKQRDSKPKELKEFKLNINYRCHNGILKLASSVIDLIWHFFPNSIDRLPREHSDISGPQPIILDGFQKCHFKSLSEGENENTADYVEFGAEQVIIVRDEKARSEVKELIGDDAGLILTVFEAKGMEFNDVLLYNFFADSPAREKWRIISPVIDKNSKGSYEHHYILSSELKYLYVAITRAKQHIWICDEIKEFDRTTRYSRPIRMYWENLELIKTEISNDKILSKLAKKSDSHEWDQKGRDFFEQRQYEQAIFCFEKSGNEESCNLAIAYRQLQIAKDSKNDSDKNTIKSNFEKAAQDFIKCSRPKQAASCYQEIGMVEKAGNVYVEWEMFEPAACCYLKIKMWEKAGMCFEKAEKYVDAISAYKDGNLYKILINFLKRNKQRIGEKSFCQYINDIKNYCRNTAISRGKFEETTDLFIDLIDNDNDVIDALQFFLYLCGIDILKKAMTNVASSCITKQKLLSKKDTIIAKIKSESSKETDQWKSLMKKFQLYLAYLEKEPSKVHEYILFFRCRGELVDEFHAISIWLHLTQSDAQVKCWHERLQHLLRLCELAFSFINPHQNVIDIEKIHENFEEIFFISKMKNYLRQIPSGSLLVHFMHDKNTIKNTKNEHIFDVNVVHQEISQFLASHIYKLIQNADQKGRDIPEIGSQISDNSATPLILYQRLKLACLQYTLMQQLDVLCHCKLLKDDQVEKVFDIQRWWFETLVKIHIRYQSPQISCPEITQTVLAKLPKHTRNGFINFAYKIWSLDGSKNGNNFEVMLKCMFVFQQLQSKTDINKFYLEMSKITMLSHPINSTIDPAVISVGRRLSLFFFFLYSNQVVRAISHVKELIQYVINNIQPDNFTPETFSDLVSLMEFTTSLIFTTSPGYCDICLPRAYLVNYFEAFTAEPLIPNQHTYSNKDHLNAIKDSFDQVQQLLNLICKKQTYSTIILRLIRLLILIGLNESTFESKAFDFLNHLNGQIPSIKTDKVFSVKIKRYLEGKDVEEKVTEDKSLEEKDTKKKNKNKKAKNKNTKNNNTNKNEMEKKDTEKKDTVKKDTEKKDTVKKDTEKKDTEKKDTEKKDTEKKDTEKKDKDTEKKDTVKKDTEKKDTEKKDMQKEYFVKVLHNDLKETGCDSLVIVHYYHQDQEGLSKFSNLEKHGIMKLAYNSVEGFHSALQQIILTEVTKDNKQLEISKELVTEIQDWFRFSQVQKAVGKIQAWYHKIHNQKKSHYDQTVNKIYNEMIDFCQVIMEEKGKDAVRKYNILLRGQTVDVIVELTKLQSKMDAIKNKLQKLINNRPSSTYELEFYLELEDDLKYKYCDKVNQLLESLSVTENSVLKHKELDIEWLENELEYAKDVIDQVREWIQCKNELE